MALQLIPKRRTLSNPSLIHLFSTSSADSDGRNDHSKSSTSTSTSTSTSNTSFSSYISDVKASLRRQQQSSPPPRRSPRTSPSPSLSFSPPSKAASLEEIRKNLTEFRRRSEPTPPVNPTSTPSFQDIYNRNVLSNGDDPSRGGRFSMEAIRNSLRQIRQSDNPPRTDRRDPDPMPLSSFKSNLRLSPPAPSRTAVFGGTDVLPQSIFGKEISKRKEEDEPSAMKTEFLKNYDYKELGEKLKQLRPDGKDKGEGWFSMEELNQRLMRLRELEEMETESRIVGTSYRELRNSLVNLKLASDEEEKKKKTNLAKHAMLSLMDRTPDFMLQPPKEHLVEKYFHPDNMSSEEKMKLELAKVRDEFKMSESDCGSARVQVAQLTTKIKHLSAVLHKKDKHSRKGLMAMVQRRKRLLKYLRRTDWDSYCFVLDKLGLRDNPDYKN